MNTSKIELLELQGSPFERGLIYGKKYADQIKKTIRIFNSIIKLDLKKDPEKFLSEYYEKQNYISSIKQYTPGLWDEIEGLAKGSGCLVRDIFIQQLMDDFFAYAGDYGSELGAVRCSSAGVAKNADNPSFIGQNLDWGLGFEDSYLVIKNSDPATDISSMLIATHGSIGTMGVNNKSVAICTNAIWTMTNNNLTGLPVTFVLRGVLDCQNYEEAVAFIKSVKHATGENFIIGDKNNVGCFECSPNKVAEYTPLKDPKRVYHTNHVLVNDDLPFPPRSKPANMASSYERFDYLDYTFNDAEFCADFDGLKEVFRSHIGGTCRHHNYTLSSGYTWASAIFELSDKPKAFFTPGPPCKLKYQEFSF